MQSKKLYNNFKIIVNLYKVEVILYKKLINIIIVNFLSF